MSDREQMRLVARWETENPNSWLELRHDGRTYWVSTRTIRGRHPRATTEERALAIAEMVVGSMNARHDDQHYTLRRVV